MMDKKIVLGLGFRKRTGKDTVADMLVARHGFVKKSFAAPLKELSEILVTRMSSISTLPVHAHSLQDWYTKYGNLGFGIERNLAYCDLGVPQEWLLETDADGKFRNLLQHLGTDIIRAYDNKFWVNAMFNSEIPDRLVISDMRFINEMYKIKGLGGFCALVLRGPENSSDTHISENELVSVGNWDYTIDNSGSLDELAWKVDEMVKCIVGDRREDMM